jgi:hypothetical protein
MFSHVIVIIYTCVQVFICHSWQHCACVSSCLYTLLCLCFLHTILVFISFKCDWKICRRVVTFSVASLWTKNSKSPQVIAAYSEKFPGVRPPARQKI